MSPEVEYPGMNSHWHLMESDFFEDLSDAKEDFFSLATRRSFHRGECIFAVGDPGDFCYYLVGGSVKIFRPTIEGKEPIFWIRRPGELFGIAEIVNRNERFCSAQALGHCAAYQVHARDFEGLLLRHARVATKVISMLGRRIRYLCGQIENITVSDVPSRLAKLLICLGYNQLVSLKGPDGPVRFRLDLTQAELAAMMGSCQQTISESLKKLEQQGIIEISGKEITILHPSEILEHTYH